MSADCVMGNHAECDDAKVDTGACSCPCHLG